jgi:hypothetical protein
MVTAHPGIPAEDGAADMGGAQGNASCEQELEALLGAPSGGGTWADRIRRIVDDAPPLTGAQRETLRLILRTRPL